MKIFSTNTIRALDKQTMISESISSLELMENAALAFCRKYCELYNNKSTVLVLCGPGNNGGDGLAITRILLHAGYQAEAILYHQQNLSDDCSKNALLLQANYPEKFTEQVVDFDLPKIDTATVIIDALFGTGLSRTVGGQYAFLIEKINGSENCIVSVDIPSGMDADSVPNENILAVRAHHTISFEFPKFCFLFHEAEPFCGQWHVVSIGLSKQAIAQSSTSNYLIDNQTITSIYKKRHDFAHKGTHGHVLLLAGSTGMAGASVLASKAALRAGAGLVTLHGPATNRIICQTSVPEVIYHSDTHNDSISIYPTLSTYNALAIGCGIGQSVETRTMFEKLLTEIQIPMVIDADALNLLSKNQKWHEQIPCNAILTPHSGEFDRLFGTCQNRWQRIEKARAICTAYNFCLVLKGKFTVVIAPNGICYFNPTGNNGLATAGTGDVLTGMLVGLLAQGYSAVNAAIIGVYLHGKAADMALKKQSPESLIASDVIENIGQAFKSEISNNNP